MDFFAHKQYVKIKIYKGKFSELIIKRRIRLCQLSEIDQAEIVVPHTNVEIMQLWVINDDWQRACSNYLGEINNIYAKSKELQFIKRTEWILPHVVKRTPISGALTLYADANKLGMAGCKSGSSSKSIFFSIKIRIICYFNGFIRF